MTIFIGFDPGNCSGAWCIYDPKQNIILANTFPTIISKKTNGGKTTELDIYCLCNDIISNLNKLYCYPTRSQEIQFILEKVHAMPKQGVTSMFSFGDGYGQLKALCRLFNGLQYHKNNNMPSSFRLVIPQQWKKQVLKGTNRDGGAAIQFVKDHFPRLDLKENRNKKPHMGVVDATCIAYYGYLMSLGNN